MLDATSTCVACASPLLRHRKPVLGLIAGGLALFVGTAYVVQTNALFETLDRPAVDTFARLAEQAPAWLLDVNELIGHFGNLGTTTFSIVLTAIWLLQREERKLFLMLGAVVSTELLWLLMIFAFNRPRPGSVTTILGEISLPGFPSGHTWMVMAFYSLLVYIYWTPLKERRWLVGAIVGVLLLTLINASNRLFSETHYLTDVIASLGIGTAWTLGSLMVVDYLLCRREKGKVQNDVR